MLILKNIFRVALLLMIMTNAGFSSSTFAAETRKPLIVDVRTEQEWDRGHLEGAILIPYKEIGSRIGSVAMDKEQKIYVYCRSGRRSAIAKKTLDGLGYQDVINLGSLQEAAGILRLKIVR